MSETLSSGLTLTIPLVGERNWQTVIRTAFSTISGHDHTGGGNGVQIGTNALASGAVTAAKIATGVISADKMNLAFTSWTPTLSAGGTMVFGSTTINVAKYMQLGKLVMFYISITGSNSGTLHPVLKFTLPVTAASLNHTWHTLNVYSTTLYQGLASMGSTSVVDVYAKGLDTTITWPSGGVSYVVQGIYEAA